MESNKKKERPRQMKIQLNKIEYDEIISRNYALVLVNTTA